MKQTQTFEPIAEKIISSQIPTRTRLYWWLMLSLLFIGVQAKALDFSVSGGFQPGSVTWLDQIQVSGSGFTPTLHYIFSIYGPLGLPGVAPADRALQGLDADATGNINGTLNIPYIDLAIVNAGLTKIPRPGRYELRVTGPGGQIIKKLINLCPETRPTFKFSQNINWGVSRGGRDGWLDDKSPERTDPEWMSVWDERPVALYATVAETDNNGNNQPDIISHHEIPASHYGHDANLLLVPDSEYQWVVGTANYEGAAGDHDTGRIEFEWEIQNDGRSLQGHYGVGNIGLPLWAMATAGDRVYTIGRWAMDHGHLEHGDRTEIHPPRLLVTMRKHHTVVPFAPANCVTRASQVDIFVSPHGGGANKFYDALSAALNDNGRGGGRIEDVMDKNADPAEGLSLNTYYTYYAYGPSDSFIVDAIKLYKQIVADVEPEVAGPSGMAFDANGKPVRRDDPAAVSAPWNQGPEERLVNDMDYDFDVPLPAPPEGATAIRVEITTHAEHTTAVNEVITYTDLVDGLPTKAHIHLPYNGADNGIYGRTLKFYWDAYNAPGRHFTVTMNALTFFLPQSFSGKEYVWVDVCGQRFFLTDLNPERLLNAKATLGASGLEAAKFDVYLDPDEKLRVFAYGFDQQEVDNFFGGDVGISAYEGAFHILGAYINAGCDGNEPCPTDNVDAHLNPNDGDSDKIGGALFQASPIPPPGAGNIKGEHNKNSQPFFYNLKFTIGYIPDPRIKVTGDPPEFGHVCLGTSSDATFRVSNAMPGLNNNDPYANSGVDPLDVTVTLSPGLSLVSPSPATFTVNAGQYQDLTVRFSPTSVNQQPGTITLTSNDICHPTLTLGACGETVQTGVRVLVLQPNGTPYSSVDQLTLNGPSAPKPTVNLKNVPLSTNSMLGCDEILYHYQTNLTPTAASKHPGNNYEIRARVGTKAKTVSFTLDNCEFKDIVITP